MKMYICTLKVEIGKDRKFCFLIFFLEKIHFWYKRKHSLPYFSHIYFCSIFDTLCIYLSPDLYPYRFTIEELSNQRLSPRFFLFLSFPSFLYLYFSLSFIYFLFGYSFDWIHQNSRNKNSICYPLTTTMTGPRLYKCRWN